jgi:hypothetical protein
VTGRVFPEIAEDQPLLVTAGTKFISPAAMAGCSDKPLAETEGFELVS